MGAEKSFESIQEEKVSNGSEEELTLNGLKIGKDLIVGPKYGEVDENRMLEIMNRMNRVVMILKV